MFCRSAFGSFLCCRAARCLSLLKYRVVVKKRTACPCQPSSLHPWTRHQRLCFFWHCSFCNGCSCRESDDNSSLLTRALAASDALDEALASYRRWRALDDVVSIERSQEHVQIPRAVLDEQYDDVPQGDVWWGKGPAAAGNGGAGGPGARGLMATYDLSSSEDSVPSSPRDSLEFHPISAKKVRQRLCGVVYARGRTTNRGFRRQPIAVRPPYVRKPSCRR